MGLRDDILKAFENNLTHNEVNQEGKVEKVKPPIGEDTPLYKLATELRKAFLDFLVKQEFRITNLDAPVIIPPSNPYLGVPNVYGPALPPGTPMPVTSPLVGRAQVSETSNQVGVPNVNSNVKSSKVMLLQVKSGTA
jgi:hypothetical protein